MDCRVHIEHGVEITGQYGEVVMSRSVARILDVLAPRAGDTLVTQEPEGERHYTLDSRLDENGWTTRYVLLEA